MKKNYLISLLFVSLSLSGCNKESSSDDGSLRDIVNSEEKVEGMVYDFNDYFEEASIVHEYDLISSTSGSSISAVNVEVSDTSYNYFVDNQKFEITILDDVLRQEIDFDGDGINESTIDRARKMQIGNTLYSTTLVDQEYTLESSCKLEAALNNLSLESHEYSGDILKFVCLDHEIEVDENQNIIYESYDYSELYMKKGVGEIAIIDYDCMVNGHDTKGCVSDEYSFSLLRE
jgi:hypothetical protein